MTRSTRYDDWAGEPDPRLATEEGNLCVGERVGLMTDTIDADRRTAVTHAWQGWQDVDFVRFVKERMHIWRMRMSLSQSAPYLTWPIFRMYSFTNVYRFLDRTSQELIARQRQWREEGLPSKSIWGRTMVFKLFNKVETFDLWQEGGWAAIEEAANLGQVLFHGAYRTWPVPPGMKKWESARRLVGQTIADGWFAQAKSCEDAYLLLSSLVGFGPFMSGQLATDLGWVFEWDDVMEFGRCGPGALNGLAYLDGIRARDIEERAADESVEWWLSEGCLLDEDEMPVISGMRVPLSWMDVQNCFCEFSKYARAMDAAAGKNLRGWKTRAFTPKTDWTEREVLLPWNVERLLKGDAG